MAPCSAATSWYISSSTDGGRVDRHRRRDLVQRQPAEQDPHVVDRVDGDTDLADLTDADRVVGVVAHLGGQVEGDRQATGPGRDQLVVPLVRLLGGAEPGVLAHRPRARRVHRRVDTAGERVAPGLTELGLGVVTRHRSSGPYTGFNGSPDSVRPGPPMASPLMPTSSRRALFARSGTEATHPSGAERPGPPPGASRAGTRPAHLPRTVPGKVTRTTQPDHPGSHVRFRPPACLRWSTIALTSWARGPGRHQQRVGRVDHDDVLQAEDGDQPARRPGRSLPSTSTAMHVDAVPEDPQRPVPGQQRGERGPVADVVPAEAAGHDGDPPGVRGGLGDGVVDRHLLQGGPDPFEDLLPPGTVPGRGDLDQAVVQRGTVLAAAAPAAVPPGRRTCPRSSGAGRPRRTGRPSRRPASRRTARRPARTARPAGRATHRAGCTRRPSTAGRARCRSSRRTRHAR